MACGTPVIACNDSYVEMVEDAGLDPAALTWTAGDADALADRDETLFDYDEGAYRDLSTRGREVARERHDLGRLMDRLVDVFAEVSS
jgi:glycosyltransferase involved in cell wall biosynthesis